MLPTCDATPLNISPHRISRAPNPFTSKRFSTLDSLSKFFGNFPHGLGFSIGPPRKYLALGGVSTRLKGFHFQAPTKRSHPGENQQLGGPAPTFGEQPRQGKFLRVRPPHAHSQRPIFPTLRGGFAWASPRFTPRY
ncbi:hypothetical protein JTE90_009216 [Oedothorax gibbosus]|uniref:Uncharacterized protein n=1 Tax=Oedothorax gibbosus TaxID=931172 RepID=A0AAV6TGZ0_9ARAC|nr:hypothetical protein JTE90_009216 [Oedothorax gibbosus]